MTTFQVESVENWASECMDLVRAHWQELGLDLDLEIAPDFKKMKAMEDADMFHIITVREDGKMVGYLLAVVSVHLHYRNSPKMLIVDAYYVDPKYRTGIGVRMIKYTEHLALRLGCIKVYFSCKVHEDHSALFVALGYRLSDFAFTRRLAQE